MTKTKKDLKCEICGNEYKYLSSHVANRGDHPSWDEYKGMYPNAKSGMEGENHPMYGKTREHSEETKQKISEALQGENHPFYGKKRSEETIRKMIENRPGMSGENNPNYGNEGFWKGITGEDHPRYDDEPWNKGMSQEEWASEEQIQNARESLLGHEPWNKGLTMKDDERVREYAEKIRGQKRSEKQIKKWLESVQKSPNNAEKELDNILGEEWKFVGGFDLIIGTKCPDFVFKGEEKKLIELFGTYWHDKSDMKERKEYFAEYEYETMIIWEDELDDEEEILDKVKRFIRGEKNGKNEG